MVKALKAQSTHKAITTRISVYERLGLSKPGFWADWRDRIAAKTEEGPYTEEDTTPEKAGVTSMFDNDWKPVKFTSAVKPSPRRHYEAPKFEYTKATRAPRPRIQKSVFQLQLQGTGANARNEIEGGYRGSMVKSKEYYWTTDPITGRAKQVLVPTSLVVNSMFNKITGQWSEPEVHGAPLSAPLTLEQAAGMGFKVADTGQFASIKEDTKQKFREFLADNRDSVQENPAQVNNYTKSTPFNPSINETGYINTYKVKSGPGAPLTPRSLDVGSNYADLNKAAKAVITNNFSIGPGGDPKKNLKPDPFNRQSQYYTSDYTKAYKPRSSATNFITSSRFKTF